MLIIFKPCVSFEAIASGVSVGPRKVINEQESRGYMAMKTAWFCTERLSPLTTGFVTNRRTDRWAYRLSCALTNIILFDQISGFSRVISVNRLLYNLATLENTVSQLHTHTGDQKQYLAGCCQSESIRETDKTSVSKTIRKPPLVKA